MFFSLQFKLKPKREGKQKLIRLAPLSAGGRPNEGFLEQALYTHILTYKTLSSL
jgi:hypothetical protein